MAIAHVQTAAAGLGVNGGTTSAIDTTGATLLVALVTRWPGGGSITLSDSKTNTWTPLTSYTMGSDGAQFFYVAAPSVGSGHTFTVSGSNSYSAVTVRAFSGTAASPYDRENGIGVDSITSIQPGSVTPSENNCLVIAGLMIQNGYTVSVDGGFTGAADQIVYTGGSYAGNACAYVIQTTAAAANPTWSWSPTSGGATNIAVFKAGAAATVVPLHLLRSQQIGLSGLTL